MVLQPVLDPHLLVLVGPQLVEGKDVDVSDPQGRQKIEEPVHVLHRVVVFGNERDVYLDGDGGLAGDPRQVPEDALVSLSGEKPVPRGVHVLYVEEHEIDEPEDFREVVPFGDACRLDRGVDVEAFQPLEERRDELVL